MADIVTARTARIVTVHNTTLFRVALDYLKDARQWSRIAQLNGLTDPWIVAPVTLSLPEIDASAGTDGVVNG